MTTIVTVIGKLTLSCPITTTLPFIQNINRITEYEPKLSEARVNTTADNQGEYRTFGYFGCIPFWGHFRYTLSLHGFHSHMVGGLLSNHMQGGFIALPLPNNQSQLWHYEEYRVPSFTIICRKWLRGYLKRAMQKELQDIEHILTGPDSVTTAPADNAMIEVNVVNRKILPTIQPSAVVTDFFTGNVTVGATWEQLKVLAA